jgi:mono/diheme cytochrome c family protein
MMSSFNRTAAGPRSRGGPSSEKQGGHMSARVVAIVAAGLFGVASAALAADPPKQESWSFGKDQFNARCAPCHGKDGKGHGPVSKQLGRTLPDLTTYAKRNGGAFPTELAWQKVDGRPIGWNEERRMPAWGASFRHEAANTPAFTNKPETYAAAEIYGVVEYVRSIQAK